MPVTFVLFAHENLRVKAGIALFGVTEDIIKHTCTPT